MKISIDGQSPSHSLKDLLLSSVCAGVLALSFDPSRAFAAENPIDADGTLITQTGGTHSSAGPNYPAVDVKNSGNVDLTEVTITTGGDGSPGIKVSGGGSTIAVRGSDNNVSTITTSGYQAYAAYIDGGASADLTKIKIATSGDQANGIIAKDAGTVVIVKGVAVNLTGSDNNGVFAYDSGQIQIEGGSIDVIGSPTVSTDPVNNGLVGYNGGVVKASDLAVTVSGYAATGLLSGTDGGTHPTATSLSLTKGIVNVEGEESRGAFVSRAGRLDVNATTFTVKNGIGIEGENGASIEVKGGEISSDGASFLATFNDQNQSQKITLDDGFKTTANDGTLLHVDRSAANGGDGVVELTIQNGSSVSGNITSDGNRTGNGKTSVTVEDASLTGALDAQELVLSKGGIWNATGASVVENITLGAGGGKIGATGALNLSTSIISGDGKLTKEGAGNVTLADANTYKGGTTIKTGALTGTVKSFGDGNTVNDGTLIINQATDASFSNVISGDGKVTKEGAGTLTLTGENTYTGGTTVSAGTLRIGNGGERGWIVGSVLDNASLVFNRSDDRTFGGVVSGTGNVQKTGAGTLTLTGENTYAGGTTVSAGTLRIGNGSASGSIVGNVIDNADLVFDRSADLAFAGDISGTGRLAVKGGMTLTLTGDTSITGGTKVLGSTLKIGNGGTTGSISGNIATDDPDYTGSAGHVVFDRSNAITYGGVISGAGDLKQAGTGTLTLTGENTFTGGTTVAAGTLRIGNGGTSGWIVGNVLDNASLVFDRSDDRIFGGVISGAGNVRKTGSGSLTLTRENTYAGGTTIDAGTLIGSVTSFGSGRITDNAALIINQTTDATFANVIDGNGSLTKTGSGTLELTGNASSFTGPTNLSQGGLKVNGSLAGSIVTVSNGTVLSGSGKVGGVVALSGSTIAPGNSPGTLTVVGNYSQAVGSTYQAELAPRTSISDKIAVGGTAEIANGAILNVSKYGSNSPYALDAHYTVLTATGGVTGTYILTGNTWISTFYSMVADYDVSNVYVDAKQTRAFSSAGKSRNQVAVADGLQSLPTGNTLRDTIAMSQTDEEARSAFNQLTGEVHSSIKGAVVEDSQLIRSAAIDRLRSAFETVGASANSSAAYGVDGLSIWSNGYGSWRQTEGDGNAVSMSHNVGGFVAGADAPVFDNWRLGVLAGYGHSNYNANERGSSGNNDSYTFGAYGGTQLGNIGLRFGTAYSWNAISTSRNVGFADFTDRLSGKYDAGLFQAFGEAGYRIDLGSVAFEPFAGLAHVSLDSDGFTEKGGLAALTTNGGSTDVTFSTLGLRSATTFAVGEYSLTAAGSVAWRHAYGNTTPMTTFNFAGSDAFGIAGLPIATDAALIDLGLSTNLNPNVSLGISYTGQFANGSQSQGVRGNLNVKF